MPNGSVGKLVRYAARAARRLRRLLNPPSAGAVTAIALVCLVFRVPEASARLADPAAGGLAAPVPTSQVSGAALTNAATKARANLRTGPGMGYAALRVLATNEPLIATGRAPAGDWYQVRTTEGADGWVSADLLRLDAGASSIPVAQVPPGSGLPIRSWNAPRGTEASRVTAVGDSVMLAASSALRALVQGIDVDAVVGRQVPAALQALQRRAAAGKLGSAVVVHIGNNGPFTSEEFDAMMEVLGGERRVVWVNDKVPRAWEGPNNAMLARAVGRYPNAVLVDWAGVASQRPELFWGDGVHLRPEGVRLYADLIASYLRAETDGTR